MSKIYGYCRISRKTQNIDRQERNIREAYPTAIIYKEVFTGTKMLGRTRLDTLIKIAQLDDTIVFDSASRMSRNVEEAMTLYEDLFDRGVNLVFLKEPHINTSIYKNAIQQQIKVSFSSDNNTNQLIESIIIALNEFILTVAREHIKTVFSQAEKEVYDLKQRTSEGILTARLNGKQIGRREGVKIETKKAKEAKKNIKKHSKDFGGTLNDKEVMLLTGIARNTYYKYKKEINKELVAENKEQEKKISNKGDNKVSKEIDLKLNILELIEKHHIKDYEQLIDFLTKKLLGKELSLVKSNPIFFTEMISGTLK